MEFYLPQRLGDAGKLVLMNLQELLVLHCSRVADVRMRGVMFNVLKSNALQTLSPLFLLFFFREQERAREVTAAKFHRHTAKAPYRIPYVTNREIAFSLV